MDNISTRKLPLRSVCQDEDTLAGIRYIVEFVATPVRVRLLDFLRHFVVCRTDPTFHCATCKAEWQFECGLAQRRHGRKFAPWFCTPQQSQTKAFHFHYAQCASRLPDEEHASCRSSSTGAYRPST